MVSLEPTLESPSAHISSFSHFHHSHFVFILILIAAFLKVTILRISLSPSAHPASPLSRLLHQLQPSWCLDSGVCGTALYVSGCRQYSGAAMSGYVAPCRQDFCKSAPSVHCPLPQPPKCCCTPAADSSELLAKAALCLPLPALQSSSALSKHFSVINLCHSCTHSHLDFSEEAT